VRGPESCFSPNFFSLLDTVSFCVGYGTLIGQWCKDFSVTIGPNPHDKKIKLLPRSIWHLFLLDPVSILGSSIRVRVSRLNTQTNNIPVYKSRFKNPYGTYRTGLGTVFIFKQ